VRICDRLIRRSVTVDPAIGDPAIDDPCEIAAISHGSRARQVGDDRIDDDPISRSPDRRFR
jgi:hypothetical protein